MAALRSSFSKTVFVNFGLAFVATFLLVTLPGERASVDAIPRYPAGDGDSRIEILRRSVAADGGEGEGMQDALKYLGDIR